MLSPNEPIIIRYRRDLCFLRNKSCDRFSVPKMFKHRSNKNYQYRQHAKILQDNLVLANKHLNKRRKYHKDPPLADPEKFPAFHELEFEMFKAYCKTNDNFYSDMHFEVSSEIEKGRYSKVEYGSSQTVDTIRPLRKNFKIVLFFFE